VRSFLFAVLLGLTPLAALAQDDKGFYVGIGSTYESDDTEEVGGPETTIVSGHVETNTADVLVGYDFGRYFGVEAAFGRGIGEDNLDVLVGGFPVTIRVSVDYFAGGFLKGTLPLGNRASAHLRTGWASFKTVGKLELFGQTMEEGKSKNSFVYGGGFGVRLRERFGLRADYTVVTLGSDDDQDFVSLALLYRF
jgi:hypothetical protein